MKMPTYISDNVTHVRWLIMYSYARAAFALLWAITAFKAAQHSDAISTVLLVCYPLWDAFANAADGARSGGLRENKTQAINVIVSLPAAVTVAVALPNMNQTIAIFGVWAILSGLLQLATALRRWWEYSAQWPMALSGAQPTLAGTLFVFLSGAPGEMTIDVIAAYAGFGAFYFLVSALLLSSSASPRDSM
ncbi:DUF308 domain-containing protein [Herbaspirillum sp. GCM10030257]|uniref:DUF308 domain-containing protein n=1 Tax=Herbaspirillum sp. GCM10030257 TaxID=3273393 RepID=UPI003606C4D4